MQDTLLLLAALAGLSSAQYVLNKTIASCADVDCPPFDADSNSRCTIADRAHLNIGMRSIPSQITEDDADLTWTVGIQSYDLPERGRRVEKDFYLGTPPGLDLARDDLPYNGCAILFHGNEMVKEDRDNSRSCEEVIGQECWDYLQEDARALFQRLSRRNTSLAPEEVCEQTRRGLNASFSDGCSAVSGAHFWHQSEAILLTGPNAPQPPSGTANQSSNCHPTLPKSNDLTHVFGYNETGTIYYNSTYPLSNAVNLVLTTFWSTNGSVESGLEEPDAQLTCLWPVDLSNEALESAEPGTASGMGSYGWTVGALAFIVGVSLYV